MVHLPYEKIRQNYPSNILEHITNFFKVLLKWLRITSSGGLLLIIVSFKNVIFDHKHDIVCIEYLINNYHHQINETNLSHRLHLHDIDRHQVSGNIESFKIRS
jgi:hypothetical protein